MLSELGRLADVRGSTITSVTDILHDCARLCRRVVPKIRLISSYGIASRGTYNGGGGGVGNNWVFVAAGMERSRDNRICEGNCNPGDAPMGVALRADGRDGRWWISWWSTRSHIFNHRWSRENTKCQNLFLPRKTFHFGTWTSESQERSVDAKNSKYRIRFTECTSIYT